MNLEKKVLSVYHKLRIDTLRRQNLTLYLITLLICCLPAGLALHSIADIPVSTASAAGGPLYLPWVGHQDIPSISSEDSHFYENYYLNPDIADLVIDGQIAYIAAGPRVIAYDISIPGKAKRLGESQMASGQIRHLALGDGLLFAMSRPHFDIDLEFARENQNLPWESELPAWSYVDVFDIEDPSHPKKRGSLELRDPADHATDIAAWGSYAYMPVVRDLNPQDPMDVKSRYEFEGRCTSWSGNDNETQEANCGFVTIDASDPDNPKLIARQAQQLFIHKSIVQDGRLHLSVFGTLESEGELRERASGLMSYPLEDDGRVGEGIFSGFDRVGKVYPALLSASGNRVYGLHNQASMLVLEFGEQERPRLVGYEDMSEDDAEWRFKQEDLPELDIFGFFEFATFEDHVYTLEMYSDKPRLSRIDARDPLSLHVEAQLDLSDLWYVRMGIERAENQSLIGDHGHALAFSPDGRLFIAGGETRLFVEYQANEGDIQELARYTEFGKAQCSLVVGDHLYTRSTDNDLLFVARVEHGQLPEFLNTVDLGDQGQACRLAQDQGRLFVAGKTGIQILDITDPTIPMKTSFIPLQIGSTVSDMLIDGDLLIAAAATQGVFFFDLNAEPDSELQTLLRSAGESQSIALDSDTQRLFVADSAAGIRVIDVRDRQEPKVLNIIRTAGYARKVAIDADSGQLVAFAGNDLLIYDLHTLERLSGRSFEKYCCGPDFVLGRDGKSIYVSTLSGVHHFERSASGSQLLDRGFTQTSASLWGLVQGPGPYPVLIGYGQMSGLIQIEAELAE